MNIVLIKFYINLKLFILNKYMLKLMLNILFELKKNKIDFMLIYVQFLKT